MPSLPQKEIPQKWKLFRGVSQTTYGKNSPLCIYLWSVRELRTTAANMLGLTKNTVGNVYTLLRHYCGRDLQDRPVIPFGGHVQVQNATRANLSINPRYVN